MHLLLLAALYCASLSQAQTLLLDSKRIDSVLAAMVAAERTAGVSALIWKGGREAYYGSAGFADREAGRKMSRDTVVQIYSMTKPVTGTALMQLWEQGKFRLDDPLSRHLPEFEAVQTSGRPISVRDVLRHTAGFAYGAGPTPAHDAYVKADPLNLSIDLAEMSRRLAKLPLLFAPGTQWSYSIAVDVQARLVEVLSGQKFADYVRQHVLEPLRMTDTAWRQPDGNWARFAAMYRVTDGKLTRQDDAGTRRLNFQDNRMTAGGFGLASTIGDYMRFARMLLGGGELEGARILKATTVKLMATDHLDPQITERQFLPSKGTVGFGFDFAVRVAPPQKPDENRGMVGEFFWDGAASTLFWVDPVNQMAVVFFTQKMPFDVTLHRDIRAAVYGAGQGLRLTATDKLR
ncbi:MAG: beta-lactamase family protein [Acidobacteria bacterium]|nr:beta-lactamase family protein [Acidobacteriota bacterium]